MWFILSRTLGGVIAASVIAVFIAIFVDFIKYNDINTVKKSKRSVVATGSMVGFYCVYYLVLRVGQGNTGGVAPGSAVIVALGVIGTLMIAAGAVVNILGRLRLKANWANHIKIYENHSLVNSGVYAIVRHPLYASIMLMLFGGSVAYRNAASAVLTAVVFVPFMYYRARQEEALLREEFSEYEAYMKNTGMFFPRLIRQGD